MILISQDKKTIIFPKKLEMLKICCENTIRDTSDIKIVYVIRLYPKLKDYFDNQSKGYIEMARYSTEERAILALEKATKYRYADSIYTFPPNKEGE